MMVRLNMALVHAGMFLKWEQIDALENAGVIPRLGVHDLTFPQAQAHGPAAA